MNRVARFALISIAAVLGTSAFQLWQDDQRAPLISHSRFVAQVASGQVSSVAILRGVMYVHDTKGGFFRVIVPSSQSALITDLQQHGVEVLIERKPSRTWMTWPVKLESTLRFGS
jgi:ATP-dependent Zn protease